MDIKNCLHCGEELTIFDEELCYDCAIEQEKNHDEYIKNCSKPPVKSEG